MTRTGIIEKTLKPIENAFQSIGYRRSLIKRDYVYSNFFSPAVPLRTIDIAVFGQEPLDYRSACFGLEFDYDGSPSETIVNDLRALGAPQLFIIRNGRSEWWINKEKKAVFREEIETENLPNIIQANRKDWNPDSMVRLKSGFQRPEAHQLDFIDIGLLPALDHQASTKIDFLIRRILFHAEEENKSSKIPFDPTTIFAVVFRLLTVKLIQDRGIITTHEIDLSQPPASLIAKSELFPSMSMPNLETLPSELVEGIFTEIRDSFSLRNLSVDTLAYIYENTFVTQESRANLGIHSTPSYVADYVLSQIPFEDLPRQKWHVLDPMCGHGIFLIAAMRRMRSMLPSDWSGSRRHEFFRERIHGIEIDPFAIEVARMCLTLADFPEFNGWDLKVSDVFERDILKTSVDNTSVIVGNPPFENLILDGIEIPKPVHMLKMALPHMNRGAIIGIVLPRSFLDGLDYRNERHAFLEDFTILSLTSLPDRVFLHSDAETVIVIAKREKYGDKNYTNYREVKDHHKDKFRIHFGFTWEDQVPQTYFSKYQNGSLILPMLKETWESLECLPLLSDIADIKIGVQYEPQEIQGKLNEVVQKQVFPDSKPGIYTVNRQFNAFVAEDTVFMSTDRGLRRKRAMGAWDLDWESPKVVVPASRMSRGPWRYAAAIDNNQRLVSRRFYAVWPKKEKINVESLAALLNAPIAQAYIYTHSIQRDIPARVYKHIPVPEDFNKSSGNIALLVKAYLQFFKKEPEIAKRILLKIDAEILKLYRLPVLLEKQLLDIFWMDMRRRVPFEFEGYIPPDVSPTISLHEYLSEKGDWSPNSLKKLSLDVTSFCRVHGLIEHLMVAIDLVKKSFTSLQDFNLSPEKDLETGEEWLLLDVNVKGNIEKILDQYDYYTNNWIASVPWPIRDKIRLSYNIS